VAKWDQIDRQTSVWTIPAALMKSDAEHRVPLSKAALAVLDRMETTKDDSEYIFPNSKGKPLSDASMAAVIDRMNELERRWIDPKLRPRNRAARLPVIVPRLGCRARL